MISSAKSNMYEVNAASTLAVYCDFVQGTGREVALSISSRPLNPAARNALTKSFATLGYGREACAWVVLSVEDENDDAGTAGGDERAAASANAGAAGAETDAGTGETGAGAAASATAVANASEGEMAPQLGAFDLMSIVEGLDPLVMVAADEIACNLLGRAYRCDISPDSAKRIMGRTCICFRNLESMLESEDGKQRAWALLKKLPRFR